MINIKCVQELVFYYYDGKNFNTNITIKFKSYKVYQAYRDWIDESVGPCQKGSCRCWAGS